MPATTVHAGLALLVAAGLLGAAYDRRALAIVVAVLVFPELDAIPGWWLPGAHRAMFHTLVLAAVAIAAVFYDATVRETSWLRARGGDWAVRVAWAAIAVHVLAHVLLDWAHLDGVNLLYPLGDQFYRLEGELAFSTTDGLVQTFVEVTEEGTVDAGQQGSTEDVHVSTPADPEPGGGSDPGSERIVPFAVHGWQLYLLLIGLFTVAARRLQGEPPVEDRE